MNASDEVRLSSLLTQLERHITPYSDILVVATDGSVPDEKSSSGIFFRSLNEHYLVCLPNYTPVFHAEENAIDPAFRKASSNISKLFVRSDLHSVLSSLEKRT